MKKIILSIVTLVTTLFLFTACGGNSELEKTVKSAYTALQDKLLDPDSLNVMSMEVKMYSEDENEDYSAIVYVSYSSGNQGGGMTQGDDLVFFNRDGEVNVREVLLNSDCLEKADEATKKANNSGSLEDLISANFWLDCAKNGKGDDELLSELKSSGTHLGRQEVKDIVE